MHALLITVLALTAQPNTARTPAAQARDIVPAQHCADSATGSVVQGDAYAGDGYVGEGYVSDGGYGGGSYMAGGMFNTMRTKKGPMPQTCYAPRYGCYPGNDRYVHRYPAFHDNYYRRPYTYRQAFEYPWHAELHEPTSLWSYNVPLEEEYYEETDVPLPPVGQAPSPAAPRDAGSARRSSPQRLGDEARTARGIQQGPSVMRQSLSTELPPVVTLPHATPPQPTPAVRRTVAVSRPDQIRIDGVPALGSEGSYR